MSEGCATTIAFGPTRSTLPWQLRSGIPAWWAIGDQVAPPSELNASPPLPSGLAGRLDAGIGDPTVGKKINALMESMNGRIGAYREGLRSDPKVLVEAVRRNLTMAQPDEAEALVQRMAALHARLERTSMDQLRAGEFAA